MSMLSKYSSKIREYAFFVIKNFRVKSLIQMTSQLFIDWNRMTSVIFFVLFKIDRF